jgi:hypothetical protein
MDEGVGRRGGRREAPAQAGSVPLGAFLSVLQKEESKVFALLMYSLFM